ncbi:hypothetical protein [Thermocoleostomius sinensis]|uniref:Uncharacterized protein n=1 Tax=Thermocoleostomius sinensis A174 TaxID=2016057 RepID=A0A9E8ZL52_9CYAN|nr:hypothetical protein [Thermocoleostomius sinensis]WAL60506.1 hypothetical protein OXH18_00490 [Thermocoleostomius sinensis A174]
MQIADLSYLETISDSLPIAGEVGVVVDAYASATGIPSHTLTDTNATVRLLPSGVGIARGRGFAVAVGEDSTAGVTVYGEGDRVIGRTKSHYFPNRDMTISRGFVIAIDLP